MKKANIVIVGYRGAGKSTLGRAIAEEMQVPFADLDIEAEFIAGEEIGTFVEKHGWQVFRDLEQRVVHDFSRNFSGIVATGGGTIENSKNLQNLKKTGNFLFLNPDFDEVKKYLLSEKGQINRPRILKDISHAQEIDQLWTQRKDIYRATSDMEFSQDYNGDLKEEAQKIVKAIPKNFCPLSPPKRRVAIFASGGGTTMEGVIEAQKRGRIPNVEFILFVTDNPGSEAEKKAKRFGIPNIVSLPKQKDQSREDYDRELINLIRIHQPDFVLLAGWMKILSPLYCDQFKNITLNVHPSLLPAYKGLMDREVHKAVLNSDDKYAGCTIHKVAAEVDSGENVLQRKILIGENRDVEVLRSRVQKQEILAFCEFLERTK